MMAFNAAEREVCTVRKDLTTTPLQALTLMNNITFVEAARFIAERIQREGGESKNDQLNFAYQLILSRKPTPEEQSNLLADLKYYRQDFTQNPKDAESLLKIGSKKRDKKLPAPETAAWTLIANTLLNLDETLTKE